MRRTFWPIGMYRGGIEMAFSSRPMRRSALIGPWGVGAIVPFPGDESLMIAGLDMWRYHNPTDFRIRDNRLEKLLGVSELRWPPDFREHNTDPQNYNLKIPAVRFPRWHYCPHCGTMFQTSLYGAQPVCDGFQWPTGRNCTGKFRRKLIPERFIVVCPDGHIDDFPVIEWIHRDSHEYNPHTCKIRRSTGGATSGLSGITYECTCGAKKSLAGVTRPGALMTVGYECGGARPWLGILHDDDSPCGRQDVKVLLRGASNVWFADTRSSILIPTGGGIEDRIITGIVEENYESIGSSKSDGMLNRTIIDFLADKHHVAKDKLYDAFVKKMDGIEEASKIDENTSEDEYRFSEYRALIVDSGSDAVDFHSQNIPIASYHPHIRKFFRSISLVPKLRETRALVGFSRLEPVNMSVSKRKKMMRLGKENWLPAIEVFGEGIFFEFDENELRRWAARTDVKDRIGKLQRAYGKSFFGKNDGGELQAEYVLIHTFAHLIINQLSFECGYGSSAIRERIYCERITNTLNMHGVLIYTASGDSDGSLGGLVRQGECGRIENTVIAAMENAMWCTSDPICIQSSGQGPESCNLAACHNCALLPETCCECGNRLLDRGLAVGTLSDPELGYFASIRDYQDRPDR